MTDIFSPLDVLDVCAQNWKFELASFDEPFSLLITVSQCWSIATAIEPGSEVASFLNEARLSFSHVKRFVVRTLAWKKPIRLSTS